MAFLHTNARAGHEGIRDDANSGQLTGVGPTGSRGDFSGDTGLDIRSSPDDGATADNDAFAVIAVGAQTRLFAVDLFTSLPTDRGAFPPPNSPRPGPRDL